MIRFNHSWILKALLIHFNSEKWYSDVFKILSLSKVSTNCERMLDSQTEFNIIVMTLRLLTFKLFV